MSVQPKVVIALKVLSETCKAARDSISNHPRSLEEPPPIQVLHKDLLSLLSLVYGTVTKLALALKPSSPTYSACLVPLKDLSERISALSHCINMFNSSVHGATITNEAVSTAIDVIISVQSLVSTFLEIEDSGDRRRDGDEYLVRTGAVHSIIEAARSSDGLPKDNISAVRKHWLKDAGPLEDGVREVEEMIEDAQDETEKEEHEDDGWDELGIEPSQPLSKEELTRTSKILNVLRFCNLLHQKVIADVVSAPDSLSNSVLDNLASLSPALLSASDELIASLSSPQDPAVVNTELNSLKQVTDGLKRTISLLHSGADTLADLLEETSLSEVASTKQTPREKWFQGCFAQIFKAIQIAAGESVVGT